MAHRRNRNPRQEVVSQAESQASAPPLTRGLYRKGTFLQHMPGEIVDVQPLHHEDDGVIGLVVETGQEGFVEPGLAPRVDADAASLALIGSSMMMRLPPRPVNVPPVVVVAKREPLPQRCARAMGRPAVHGGAHW